MDDDDPVFEGRRTRDALNRRLRGVSVSTGRRVSPFRPFVLTWFEEMQRLGDATAYYLTEYTKQPDKKTTHQRRVLGDLHHESNTKHGGRYLERKRGYRTGEYALTNDAIYSPTKRVETVLKGLGRWHENTPKTSGSLIHDFMGSCILHSANLISREKPDELEFIYPDEIIAKLNGVFEFPVPFFYKDEPYTAKLKPDAPFGIRYKRTGGARIFLQENDCKTETNNTEDMTIKSWKRNLLQYDEFIGKRLYREFFWPGARVMLLGSFSSKLKKRNIMELQRTLIGPKDWLLYRHVPGFIKDVFKPPRPMWNLLSTPCERVDRDPFYMGTLDGKEPDA